MVLFRLTHARRAEADHARRQHDAERQQQNGEQTEEHIQPAEPQPGERGGTALCTLRRGLKLRGKVGGASEAGGDLYLINGNMTKLEDAGLFAGKETTRKEHI